MMQTHKPLPMLGLVGALLLAAVGLAQGQVPPLAVRTAYSALSAGIGTFRLTHKQGPFRKHGLESNLIYIRGGTTAVQALLAGEFQFGHLSLAPMMTAWVQGADFVWIGTTTHQMVFTLIAAASIARGSDLKGKKIGTTRLGSTSDLAVRDTLLDSTAQLKQAELRKCVDDRLVNAK